MKVLLYAFIIIMLLEAFTHSTRREGMLTAEDIFAELDKRVSESGTGYEDEEEY